MKNSLVVASLVATIGLFACKSQNSKTTSPQKTTKAKKAALDSQNSSDSSESDSSDEDVPSEDSVEEGEDVPGRAKGPLSDLDLARKFAPLMKLPPQELYYPMDPEEFLKNKNQDEAFFRSARKSFHEGKQGRTIVNMSEDKRVLQYWYFFAKNGCQGARFRLGVPNPFGKTILSPVQVLEFCNLAIHEGDWENVTVKLNADKSEVEQVYISAHGHGNWLSRGAFEWKDARPIVYSALNSHALYAKDQRFHSEFTANSSDFPPALGVQWFQFGDTVGEKSSVHVEPNDGKGWTDFDTAKALWLASDLMKTETGAYKSDWGKKVDAQKVLPPPGADNAVLRKVLEEASKIAFDKVPALKGKSGGGAPPSPWVRDDWKNFDRVAEARMGVSRELIMGPAEGIPFDDYTRLKGMKSFRVNQVSVWHNGDEIIKVCLFMGDQHLCHGQQGGTEKLIRLGEGEYISEVMTFNQGQARISGLKIVSSKDQKLEVGQQSGGNNVHVKASEGLQIVGWYGHHDTIIHSLGVLQGTR